MEGDVAVLEADHARAALALAVELAVELELRRWCPCAGGVTLVNRLIAYEQTIGSRCNSRPQEENWWEHKQHVQGTLCPRQQAAAAGLL